MSNYWKAIRLAVKQGYSANVRTGAIFGRYGKPLKIRRCGKQDYPTVRLHVRGLPKPAYSVAAHKFIAFLIWGRAAFARGIHVRHRDGNSENNARSNLRLGTPSQNERDKPKAVRVASAKAARAAQGVTPKNAKLSCTQALHVFDVLAEARTHTGRVRRGVVKKLAELYDVSPSAISLIGKEKSWIASLS